MKKIKNVLKENIKFIIFLIVMVTVINIPLPYYILAPGGIIDIRDRIEVANKNATEGTLNLLYVTEYEANVGTMLMSFILKDWDTEKVEEVQLSNESMEEIAIRNKVMLENSLQNAILVAYNKSGNSVSINGKENVVIATTVDNGIKVGDKILKANGINIDNVDTLKEIISKTEIGANISLDIIRDDEEQQINVEVTETEDGKAIGVVVLTNYLYEVDPELELSFKASEGGASGGLMIALNIYNALTPDDITKGRKIAGTGTIDALGNVGAIDGVKYKIIGAYKNKMEIVFVPKDNYEEAIKVKEEYNYDMEIISVDTFDDALNYLINN